jgi:hypothetical protein
MTLKPHNVANKNLKSTHEYKINSISSTLFEGAKNYNLYVTIALTTSHVPIKILSTLESKSDTTSSTLLFFMS